MSLLGVYPLYKVLYEFVPTKYRGIVVLVLPFWRFIAKTVMVRATREMENFMPQVVAFSVDFYGALFISVCMTTSGSIYLSALIIATDLAQSLLEFREARANATTLLQLVRDRQKFQNRLPYSARQSLDSINLLEMILAVARDLVLFHVTLFESVRLCACVPHPLTKEQARQLDGLEASGVFRRGEISDSKRTHQRSRRASSRSLQSRLVVVAPAPSDLSTPSTPESTSFTRSLNEAARGESNMDLQQADNSKKLVQQGLQLLFHCEYLVLVEYIECIVPLVYDVFKSILEQLPNIVYYPGGAGTWSINTAMNVLLLAALEVGSFLLLNAFCNANLRFLLCTSLHSCWKLNSIWSKRVFSLRSLSYCSMNSFI